MANNLSTAISTIRGATPAKLVTISFMSQVSPTLVVDPTNKTTSGKSNGFSDFLMRLIKPAVVVDTPAGQYVSAPWGNPSANFIPALILAGTIGVLAVLGATYALGKRSGSE